MEGKKSQRKLTVRRRAKKSLIKRMCFVPNLAVRHTGTSSNSNKKKIHWVCALFNWKLAKSNKISTQSQLHSNILSLRTGFTLAVCTTDEAMLAQCNTFLADGCIDAISLQHFLRCLWCQPASTFHRAGSFHCSASHVRINLPFRLPRSGCFFVAIHQSTPLAPVQHMKCWKR